MDSHVCLMSPKGKRPSLDTPTSEVLHIIHPPHCLSHCQGELFNNLDLHTLLQPHKLGFHLQQLIKIVELFALVSKTKEGTFEEKLRTDLPILVFIVPEV